MCILRTVGTPSTYTGHVTPALFPKHSMSRDRMYVLWVPIVTVYPYIYRDILVKSHCIPLASNWICQNTIFFYIFVGLWENRNSSWQLPALWFPCLLLLCGLQTIDRKAPRTWVSLATFGKIKMETYLITKYWICSRSSLKVLILVHVLFVHFEFSIGMPVCVKCHLKFVLLNSVSLAAFLQLTASAAARIICLVSRPSQRAPKLAYPHTPARGRVARQRGWLP